MILALDPAAAGLIGVALGGVLTCALTVLQGLLDRRHATALRADERRHAADAFQADTLLELQYGLQRLASAGMSARDWRLQFWNEHKDWNSDLPPDHRLAAELGYVGVAVRALCERLVDDNVRQLALHIQEVAVRTDDDPESASDAIERLLESYIHIQPMIGERLRSLPPPTNYERLIDRPTRDSE